MSRFIEMFGSLERVKLADYIKVVRGVSYKPDDVRDAEGAIILRSNNINNGELNLDDIIRVNPARVSMDQRLQIGDIVICASNGSKALVGKAAVNKNLEGNIAHGAFCILVRPISDKIEPYYLNTFFQTRLYKDQIDELAAGSNILNIKPDYLNDMELPIPDIDTQKMFVEVVEQADKSKFELREAIKRVESMMKSLIN